MIAIDSSRSIIEGSIDFDPPTLISALRIATAYDYPALRAFTINKLEKTSLSAIERIRIAREFRFTSWEAPAYVELCGRDEAISEDEANMLGMSAFVQVARMQEKEQRRKGSLEADTRLGDDEPEEERHGHVGLGGPKSQASVAASPIDNGKKKKKKKNPESTTANPKLELLPGGEQKADEGKASKPCECGDVP
jgi:hypothetical protein